MIQRGILCIDAECALCRRLAARWGPALRRGGIRLAALQAPWVQRRLGLAGVPEEMKLLLPDGRILGGAAALVELAAVLAWPRPLVRAARQRPASALLGAAYRWVARHRHCSAGGCRLQG
jgi:predicted DCC family thiol-disulfide oxidoreductase YuxK